MNYDEMMAGRDARMAAMVDAAQRLGREGTALQPRELSGMRDLRGAAGPIDLGGGMGGMEVPQMGAPMMETGRGQMYQPPTPQPDQLKQHLGAAATAGEEGALLLQQQLGAAATDDEKSALLRALRGIGR